MYAVSLTTVHAGINRLRTKGGARPDGLYDLVNGVVTPAGTVKMRPGTERHASIPTGTVGLTAFDGKLNVFSSTAVDLAAFPSFKLSILLHPDDKSQTLMRVHFAEPFLGALYVVAEFGNGDIFHYWLQDAEPWKANTGYSANEFVTPTSPNGFVYRALRLGSPYPSWAPGVVRAVNDKIEPSEYNEYYYQVVATQGDNPRSGSTEPVFPTHDGQKFIENTDGFEAKTQNTATPPTPPEPNQPQAPIQERYQR